jgi:hypothetical protein
MKACTCRHPDTDNTLIHMISENLQKDGGEEEDKNNEKNKTKVPGELSSSNKCETRPKRMAHLAKEVPTTLRQNQ